MSSAYFVLWALLFCVGAVVGVGTVSLSITRGGLVAIACGAVGILEFIAISTYSVLRDDVGILLQFASVLFFGFVLWGIGFFFVTTGFAIARVVRQRMGIGWARPSIWFVTALIAIYFAIAAAAMSV